MDKIISTTTVTDDLFKENKDVVKLFYKDFKKTNKKIILKPTKNNKQNGLIMFYKVKCIYCRKIEKTWIDLAKQFKNKFTFYVVNIDDVLNDNDLIRLDLNIKSYPTIKYVNDKGKLFKYEGNINKDDMLYFIYDKI